MSESTLLLSTMVWVTQSLTTEVGTRALWLSCRSPRVCPDAQDYIRTERQPIWRGSCCRHVKLLWSACV